MIIDARLRPATRPYLTATVCNGRSEHYHRRFGVGKADSVREQSMELCLREMDEAGIDLGVAAARWGGGDTPIVPPEEVSRILSEYPRRFYGAIALCPAHLEDSFQMLDTYVVHGASRAVSLEPGRASDPMFCDDPRIYPLYETLQRLEIPLFIMIGGVAGPDLRYSAPERLDRVLAAFPRLAVISVHGGIPYVDEAIYCALRRPNLFLCPDMFLCNTPYAGRFVEAANGMLQDQILFGSSYPYVPMKEALDIFRSLPFKKDVLARLLCDNAARALHIDVNASRRF